MPIDRQQVRALVKKELAARLGRSLPAPSDHPAMAIIASGPECSDEPGASPSKPCVIEPSKPCFNSGYCKKLGF